MESQASASSDPSSGRFWLWLVGYRLVWLLVFGLPSIHLGGALAPAARFYMEAAATVGRVGKYGMDIRDVALAANYVSAWSKESPDPWVDVLFEDADGVPMTCRMVGQLGVFGRWISDDREVVAAELRRRVEGWRDGVPFFRADQSLQCAISRDIGLDRWKLFLPFLALTVGFAIATIRALRGRYSRKAVT